MLESAVMLLQWLPRLFIWLVPPIAFLSALLALPRTSRPHAALGLMIAAAISGIFLALETAAFGYICCDQARMLFSILLDFRAGVAIGFAVSLVGSIAKPLAGMLPTLIGTAATGLAAFLLRRSTGAGASQTRNTSALAHGEPV